MITVISGTNRPEARTLVFARHFADHLAGEGHDVRLLDLGQLDLNWFAGDTYNPETMPAGLRQLQDDYFLAADRLAIFVPEYNDSYPGIVKLLIDAMSIRRTDEIFGGKYVALFGVASGRGGNPRGMDHLGSVVSHMGAWVLPAKTPISRIHELLDGDQLTDERTIDLLRQRASELLSAGRAG